MNSVWISERDGKTDGALSKDALLVYANAVNWQAGRKCITVRRYVPASELTRLRRKLAATTEHLKTAIWCDSQELKYALKENRRLRKAVEWMLTAKHPDISWVNELARRAGLRWDGKKWVKK